MMRAVAACGLALLLANPTIALSKHNFKLAGGSFKLDARRNPSARNSSEVTIATERTIYDLVWNFPVTLGGQEVLLTIDNGSPFL